MAAVATGSSSPRAATASRPVSRDGAALTTSRTSSRAAIAVRYPAQFATSVAADEATAASTVSTFATALPLEATTATSAISASTAAIAIAAARPGISETSSYSVSSHAPAATASRQFWRTIATALPVDLITSAASAARTDSR